MRLDKNSGFLHAQPNGCFSGFLLISHCFSTIQGSWKNLSDNNQLPVFQFKSLSFLTN